MQTIDKIVCARTLTEERKETENLVRSGVGSVNDFKWLGNWLGGRTIAIAMLYEFCLTKGEKAE